MELDIPDVADYFPYAIYAIILGAVIMGFAQDHRALALYCIVIATVAVISYIWEAGI